MNYANDHDGDKTTTIGRRNRVSRVVKTAILATVTALAATSLAFKAGAHRSGSERAAPCGRDWVPRENQPVASRDGRTLAWSGTVRNNSARVYASARDGSGVRVVPGIGAPEFLSPDGSQLLGGGVLASTRGRDSRLVTPAEARELRRRWRAPEWSPDGRFAVYADPDGLLVVPADGRDSRRIALPRPAENRDATWSPDGLWIAFVHLGPDSFESRLSIYVVRADGSAMRRLAFGEGPKWSPDGSLIAFDVDESDVHGGYSIAVVRPNGSGRKRLAGGNEGPDRRSANQVSWVDVRTLVFVSFQLRNEPSRKVVDIHTIRSDGTSERRVTYQCHLGTPGPDRLSGSLLGDTILTFGGNDTVAPGPGADYVDAGSGNDFVTAAHDRVRDAIHCGSGLDSVIAERRDRVARDCERVTRLR